MTGKARSWNPKSVVIGILACIGFAIAGIFLWGLFSALSSGTRVAEEDRFRSLLSADSRIENISFQGYEEVFEQYTIISASFSIRGKPNSHMTLLRDDYTEFSSLRVMQIGNLCPVMLEWDSHVRMWSPRSPTLGSDSKYRPPLPWKDMTLSQLVTDYDKVVDYFSRWSTAPEGETMTTDGGLKVRCRVDPADASLIKQFIPPGDGN